MAQVSVRLGDAAAAENLADESLKIALELGAIPDALYALLYRAEAVAMLDRVDESLALLAMIRAHPLMPPAGQHEIDGVLRRLGMDEASVMSATALTFDEVTAALLNR